jgi:peptidoglycan hydrolase-like protein with peptidoglycan-binding domain
MASGYFQPGDQAIGVQALQTNLIGLGYGLAVDGTYGPETEAAVRSVQQAAGIRVDGLDGPDTQAAISRALISGWRTADPTPWLTDEGTPDPVDDNRPTVVTPSGSPGNVVPLKKPAAGFPWITVLVLAAGAWWVWKKFLSGRGKAED